MTRLPTISTFTTTFAAALATTALCHVAQANPILGALGETKPIADFRVRSEYVDQNPPPAALTEHANAVIARGRLGIETGKAWNTSLLVEGEFVTPLQSDYRSDTSVRGYAYYPVIADPESYEVNRAQFTNTSLPNTAITLGRQRIVLDDQRFVGNVGWRMNEQTYDALRVVPKFFNNNLTVDATYINRVNRVFGPDSPQGDYKGDLYLGNVAYQFKPGKLTGFAYLLDFDPITTFTTGPGLNATQRAGLNPARVSSKTFGARFAGSYNISKIKLTYAASWAQQKDYGSYDTTGRPHFDNDYYLAELTGTFRQWSLGVGVENLQGDGVQAFQTPLATLHKFQGWVDKFLTTPANGIDDRYVTAGFQTKSLMPFETVALTAVYHTYESERLSQDYGDEINLQVAAKWSRFTGTIKYGAYNIDKPLQLVASTPTVNNAFSTLADTKKWWVQLDYVW